MKKAILFITMLGIISCSDSSETVAENGQSAQQQKIDEFKDYSGIIIRSKTEALQLLINESLIEYESLVDQIRKNFKQEKLSLEKEILDNINEIKKDVSDLQLEYTEKCSNPEKNVDECNVIGSNLVNAKNALAKTESIMKNELNKLMENEINTLRKYQAQMKNNINKLLAQEQ